MSERRAQLLVFSTSAAVLVLEILAGRLMAPYVGVSLETFTGIIGVILAGIALGSAVGGKLADRHEPTTLLGPALILGGVLAWLALPIVGVLGPSAGPGNVAIIALPLFAFFAPAAVLSAVSPMVAKLRVDDLTATGTVVGGLSAAGTAGALFGTFVTGFFLVSAVPTRPIVIGLGAALVITGFVMTRRLPSALAPNRLHSMIGLVVLASAVFAPRPCEFESAYACGRVVVDENDSSLRFLVLDTLRHGAVDLDDPTHLEFRYTRLLGDVIDATPPGEIDGLHIGGGGFSIPRYIAATRPGSSNLVLEIDPVLVDVARDELGLVTDEQLVVDVGDARLALPELQDDTFDVIVGDAFGGLAVPWHLTTTEFIAEVERVLRPQGIYVMNVIDGDRSRFARAELATLQEHFDHVAVIVPADGVPNRAVNQILIASDRPIPTPAIDPDNGRLIEDVDSYIADASVLTDDFAPVEQLALNP